MDGIKGTPLNPAIPGNTNDLKITVNQINKRDGDSENSPMLHATDTVALTHTLAAASGGLKPGERVAIKVGKQEVATIEKMGVSNWDRMMTSAKSFGVGAVNVTKDAINTDPSFVFRETVEMAKDPLTQTAPEAIRNISLKYLYPGVRVGVLGLDVKKAISTWKDPKSTIADKVIDIAHCVTDVGGLVGVGAPLVGLAIPGAAGLAAAAVVFDIVAFSYHTLMFCLNKPEDIPQPMPGQLSDTQTPPEIKNKTRKT